jgi:hypothetical protein
LFDTSRGEHGERIAEYRYDDVAISNSGVVKGGGSFLRIHYARLARLLPGGGLSGDKRLTANELPPANDGIFKVSVAGQERRLRVSDRETGPPLKTK